MQIYASLGWRVACKNLDKEKTARVKAGEARWMRESQSIYNNAFRMIIINLLASLRVPQ